MSVCAAPFVVGGTGLPDASSVVAATTGSVLRTSVIIVVLLDAAVRSALLDQIIAANPFDVPPSWVNRMIDDYMQAYQIPDEQRRQFAGEFAAVAEKQVRRGMLIDALAEQHQLAASEKDVDDRVAKVAEQRGTEPGQVYASLQKAGRLPEIERSITEEKVFEWLTSRNDVINAIES